MSVDWAFNWDSNIKPAKIIDGKYGCLRLTKASIYRAVVQKRGCNYFQGHLPDDKRFDPKESLRSGPSPKWFTGFGIAISKEVRLVLAQKNRSNQRPARHFS